MKMILRQTNFGTEVLQIEVGRQFLVIQLLVNQSEHLAEPFS